MSGRPTGVVAQRLLAERAENIGRRRCHGARRPTARFRNSALCNSLLNFPPPERGQDTTLRNPPGESGRDMQDCT